ncbi:MAG: hypothetical protein RL756_2333 [Pseudomonadota bacterium]
MSETLIVPTVTIKLRLGYLLPVLFSPAMDIDYGGSCYRYRDHVVWHRELGAAFAHDIAYAPSLRFDFTSARYAKSGPSYSGSPL